MRKTNVFLLVPTYSGVTGTIRAAFDLAQNVAPNGPVQFRLVDYPEENPKHYTSFRDPSRSVCCWFAYLSELDTFIVIFFFRKNRQIEMFPFGLFMG